MNTPIAQCLAEHQARFGAPTALATAPTTWLLLGEHTEAYGGITLAAALSDEVAVAYSPRDDEQIQVTEIWQGHTTTTSCAYEDADQFHNNQDATAKKTPQVTAALRAALLMHTLNFRQILHPAQHGLNITIYAEVAADPGIGTQAAADVALALTLVGGQEHSEDAPLRAKIADVCYQVSKLADVSYQPRSRFTTALRARPEHITLVDDIDDSVKYVPNRLTKGTVAPALCLLRLPKPPQPSDLAARFEFFQQAAQAFAADSLRQLPDAAPRVMSWLQANHEVRGPKNFVSLADADNWLRFAHQECTRVFEAERALNSRGSRSMLQILNDSQSALSQEFQVGSEQAALAELALSWNAKAARSTYSGVGHSVMALVNPTDIDEFVAQADAVGISSQIVTIGVPAQVQELD